MTEIYSTLAYDQKFLIVKTPLEKPAFVIAECYSPKVAETICRLLNEEAAKGEPNE